MSIETSMTLWPFSYWQGATSLDEGCVLESKPQESEAGYVSISRRDRIAAIALGILVGIVTGITLNPLVGITLGLGGTYLLGQLFKWVAIKNPSADISGCS